MKLGPDFCLPINNLPHTLKILCIYDTDDYYNMYEHELNNLPCMLEYLELPQLYKKEIKNLCMLELDVRSYSNRIYKKKILD